MLAFKPCQAVWRFHLRKTFVLFAVGLLLFTVSRLYAPKKDSLSNNENLSSALAAPNAAAAVVIPIDGDDSTEASVASLNSLDALFATDACPLCFGSHDCDELMRAVTYDGSPPVVENKDVIVRKASWRNSESVLVKTVPSDVLKALRRRMCLLAKLPSNCKASAIAASDLARPENSLRLVRYASDSARRNRSRIPATLCATRKLVTALQEAMDDDGDGNVTGAERMMLLATLVTNPEAIALKFFRHFRSDIPVAQLYGTCGRSLVVEGGLTPLKEFLREPFEVRASLAAKLLQVVDDFLEDDPDWAVLFSGFRYDNLAVDKDGEPIILDAQDLVFIDKSEYPALQEAGDIVKEPCNRECFAKFVDAALKVNEISEMSETSETCRLLPQRTHVMYAILCQEVLSNLDEHKADDVFELGRGKTENAGLLHGLPEKDRDTIEELLRECVSETEDGGRVQAAEELRDILSEYANEELDEAQDEKEADEGDDLDDA